MQSQHLIAVVVWAVLALAGCSRDTPLLTDYTLYDNDGSNQAIIGGQGMIAVSDVTAVAIKGSIIFVEFGGNYQHRNCSYKLIDTSKNSMIGLSMENHLRREAIAAIKNQKLGVVSRSCAVPT